MTTTGRRRTLHHRHTARSPGEFGEGGTPCRSTSSSATFAEQFNDDELDEAGIKLVNDDVGIRWVYSFLSADKKKPYCLYGAPNPEALRKAAARLGIPAE